MSTLIQITKPTELIVNNTPIIGGVAGRVLFQGTGNVLQQSSSLFWDETNGRLELTTTNLTSSYLLIKNSTTSNELTLRAANTDSLIGFNNRLFFLTSTTLTINQAGNVGIGISNPTTKFQVASGTVALNSTSGNTLIGTTTDAGFRLDVNGTARVQGNLDLLFTSVTNNPYLNIFSETQTNSRPIVFNTAGTTGGAASGYEFRAGFGGSNGSTAFRIWGGSTTSTRVGIGNLTESNLQGGNAQVYINSQITGGRNAGVRITPPSTSTTEFSGIQFDIINKDSNGGAFIGSQYNPLTNGYDTDLVILTTGTSPNSYSQTARFMGKYNSFYVGTDKTLAVASAKMQVESTTQGFLPPRMTTTQKNAIASPAAGLVVYDTTLNKLCVFTTTWETITSL